jgi:hypothetical protein
MLGVGRFGAILGAFMGGVLLSLGWGLPTHYGRFGGDPRQCCCRCPAEDPQVLDVGPARHG